MAVNKEVYQSIKKELDSKQVILVAVSKTKPIEDILELYNLGQRDFGENYVQELVDKSAQLPKDIRWHFIGHLQTNKVKLIAPFVQLIHGVDSLRLLKEINKEGERNKRVIDCLLQIHIAAEETKFGLDEEELNLIISQFVRRTPGEDLKMTHVRIAGLMGMASFTNDTSKIRKEFQQLRRLFDKLRNSYAGLPTPTFAKASEGKPDSHLRQGFGGQARLKTLSMGMSSDYWLAVEEGTTMVRIGSLLFGERTRNQ